MTLVLNTDEVVQALALEDYIEAMEEAARARWPTPGAWASARKSPPTGFCRRNILEAEENFAAGADEPFSTAWGGLSGRRK